MHINSVFWTFQGEGFHAGRRALFVRMPYCDLKCPWCDTSFDSHTEWNEEALANFAVSEASRFAVVTGGEPMMHKHTPQVVMLLKVLGFEVACETNGHFPIVHGIDFVTVSPKSYGKIPFAVHPDAWVKAHEFKYVVEKGFPFSMLDRHNVCNDGRRYSLSPEYNRMKESLAEIQQYISTHPQWRISLQTHKWMEIP